MHFILNILHPIYFPFRAGFKEVKTMRKIMLWGEIFCENKLIIN